MERDSEGFYRPVIDEAKCVSCSLCEKKCPVNSRTEAPAEMCAYAAFSKDKEIRKSSSSGGIFAHLAKSIIKEGGAVFGAGYNDGLKVAHKTAESETALSELLGSKYVQSDTEGVYKEVKSLIDAGKKVLFSGTPCQCAALRGYVGEREELFIVSFICHGVPSPALWEKYVKEEFTDAVGASFRDKKRGWEEFSMRVDTKKGSYNRSLYKDPYLRMFLRNLCLRPSCHNCSWKSDGSAADVMIADFWGVSKSIPQMNDDKGTSLVLLRSEKGKKLFEKIKGELVAQKTDPEKALRANTAYEHSVACPERRKEFFKDLESDISFESLSKKYIKPVPDVKIIAIRMKRTAKKVIGKVSAIGKRN